MPETDDEMLCAAARVLQADNPLWIVLFGVYTKQFVAFPRFGISDGGMVVARYPETLTARMREVERQMRGYPAERMAR